MRDSIGFKFKQALQAHDATIKDELKKDFQEHDAILQREWKKDIEQLEERRNIRIGELDAKVERILEGLGNIRS